MTAGPLPDPAAGHDAPPARALRAAAEAVLLALVAVTPWPFGAVDFHWTLVVYAGLAVLAGLWAAHAAVTGRFVYRADPVSTALLGLVLLTAAQLLPLPERVVAVVSPAAAGWHRTLRPAAGEVLPGEAAAAPRPGWLPLSVDPAGTRNFLPRVVAVFLAYAVTRNLLASKHSFRRLAWVGFATGVLLAVLALAQFFTSPRSRLYWSVDAVNEVFGPFVNRNHYPFYLALCGGLGLGLLGLAARERGAWRTPRLPGLVAGLGLMAVSVPFSLSRGGMLAVAAAAGLTAAVGWRRDHDANGRRAPRGLLVGLLLVAGAVGTWLGWEPVGRRLGTLRDRSADNRSWIWREAVDMAARFPAAGTGGGTFGRAERLFRSAPPGTAPDLLVDYAHNEYLEAAAEGGVGRLALTAWLAVAAVWAAAAGARRLRRRSAGPMLFGATFGLAAVAFQSVVDFGLHLPAVALLAAVVAGQAVAAADGRPDARSPDNPEAVPAPPPAVVLTGPAAYLAAAVVLVAAGQVAWAGWRDVRVYGLRRSAERVLRTDDPNRHARAAAYLRAAARVHPDDAEVWNDLAAAHLAAAAERAAVPFVAAAGGVAATHPPEPPPPGPATAHLVAGLQAARTARDRCPLLPGPHLRLGAHAGLFVRGEPAAVHFARAVRVGGADPDVWFLSGAAALDRGEFDTAWADWRECLRRSPRRAATKLTPDEVRARVLPDDPAAWVAATDALFPDSGANADARRAWLRAAVRRWEAGPDPTTAAGWLAWADAADGADDPAAALAVLRRAADRQAGSAEVRDRLARRLEDDEQLDAAAEQLEWLLARQPDHAGYRFRLEAVRHAQKLRREIESP